MKKALMILLTGPMMMFATCTGVNWGTTQNLFNVSGQNGVLPNVAIDPNGNAVAAWINSPANGSGIAYVQASYRIAGGRWSVPRNISGTTIAVQVSTPAVAIDNNGNAVVAWYQFGPNSVYTIQAQIRPAGSSGEWIAVATPISPATSNAGDVVVAWDGNENAVIGWSIFGGVFQATSVSLTGATSGVVTVSNAGENTSSASMIANANGDIIAIWINSSATGGRQVEASIKVNGQAWPAAPQTVSPSSDIAMFPAAAMDTYRNAVIVWSVTNGATNDFVRSSQRLVGSNFWSSALTITSTAANPALALVGMDNSGNVTSVWSQNPGAPVTNVVVQVGTKKLSDSSWALGSYISDPANDAEGCLSLGVDSVNEAVAIWSYDAVGTYLGAIASESSPLCSGGDWLSPESTLSSSVSSPGSCSLSINPTGSIVAVWSGTSTTTTNSVIQYSIGNFSVLSPTNLSGEQYSNDFGILNEYYNQLSWVGSPSPSLAGYNIYQNGVLIGTVGSFTTKFQQHNQFEGVSSTYTVKAFNSSGQESVGVSVTIN